MKATANLKALPHLIAIENARAIDGDTIEATIYLGFDVYTKARLRLRGFYAPELDGGRPDEGRAARDVLQAFLNAGMLALARNGLKKDNHGRWLGTLWKDLQLVDPAGAIWPYQLTPEAHALDLAEAKRNRRKGGASL